MVYKYFQNTALMALAGFSTGYSANIDIPEKADSKIMPNVLMICIDDLNDWLGCMNGHPNTKTPNIDRLAAQGTLFTNAHCQAPVSGPSRASIMTGLLPSTTGIYGMVEDNKIKESSAPTEACTFLPEYFRQQGYYTMGVGKIFHEHAPDGVLDKSGGRIRGFGPNAPQRFAWSGNRGEGYSSTSTDWGAFPEEDSLMPDYQSAQWVVARLKEDHEKPFFLAVGFIRPHVPWYVPQKWFDLHPVDSLETPPYLPCDMDDIPEIGKQLADVPMMPTTEWAIEHNEWKKIVQAYLACISFVDHYVGEVLKALEESPYADNTIVVLWSDHGYHLGEKNRFAKHSLWEEATRAPLIITAPGKRDGQVCSKPVGMIDIYPTLLELCGLPSNNQNEGTSLNPLLDDPEVEWRHAAITTYARNNHAVRDEHFRYIRYENGEEEFYDHRNDREEWYNLVGRKEYDEIIQRMRQFLPKVNAPWAETSRYDFNKYLKDQKEISSQ